MEEFYKLYSDGQKASEVFFSGLGPRQAVKLNLRGNHSLGEEDCGFCQLLTVGNETVLKASPFGLIAWVR